MENNCLGGWRSKQKQQPQQKQQSQKQIQQTEEQLQFYQQQQQQSQSQIYPQHHYYYLQQQQQQQQQHSSQNQKHSNLVKSMQQPEHFELDVMHPFGSNESHLPLHHQHLQQHHQHYHHQEQQQQHSGNCSPNQGQSLLYPHFPPPPDYPPPMVSTSNSKQNNVPSPITGGHQMTCSIETKGCQAVVKGIAPGSNTDGSRFVENAIDDCSTAKTIGISSNGRRLISRYPDDPDAIEVCNEQEPTTTKPQRNKKSTGNIRMCPSNGGSGMCSTIASGSGMGISNANGSSSCSHANNILIETNAKWSRNNISTTIEKCATAQAQSTSHNQSQSPTNLPNTPLHHHHHHHLHQDYSYAYYEPGAAMRHSNIPPPEQIAGPSRPPPPNSIRALLSKGKKNKLLVSPATRQSYQSRYGGRQENFYEEISSDNSNANGNSSTSMNHRGSGSSISVSHSSSSGLGSQSMVEEEFRQVQNRHRKILGELNLSVEAMLMPETPPNGSPTENETPLRLSSSDQLSELNLLDLLNTVGPTDELLSPIANTNPTFCGDLDSGFSGSSGASYIGSLRIHKTNAALSNLMTNRKTAISGFTNNTNTNNKNCNFFNASGSCRSSQRSQDESGNSNFLGRSSYGTMLHTMRMKSAEDPGPEVATESKARSFWSRKGWKKLPGFSSTSSIHKAGLNDEPKLNSGSWEDPLPVAGATETITTAQLHNAPLRRSDPLNSRSSYNGLANQLILPHHHHSKSCGNSNSLGITANTGSIASGGTTTKKRLEHTHSARTINSSEDSWCSERSEQDLSSEEDEEEDDRSDRSSITSSTIAANQQQQQQQQQQQRNSQLRSTFNRAKQHLSFDKWRTSGGGGAANNSTNTQTTQQLQQQQQQSSAIGNDNVINTTTNTMPTAHHHHHQDTTTPGESPGGRLSRWFSIRRGSSHQYDIGGRHSTSSSSIDTTDATTIENTSPKIISSTINSSKMPELKENDDDPAHTFGLDFMLPPGSRANGTARPHSRLIMPSLPPAPPGLSQQQLKRRHIVAAIVHSENSYVATLQRLVNDYKKPLEESSPPVLSSSKISVLFHRLPDILQSHKIFRIALSECVRHWDRDEKLGDVFVSAFSKPQILEVYSGFINNFSAAMELAKMEAKRKSALADFFKVKQISAHDRLSFFGLMVKPVQRFPQFILFLQDMLKYTPQGHHDRMSLQLALTQLESLAEMLNERKREAEQYQAFKEMLGHISGTFNTRSLASSDGSRQRYLLREDNVTQMEFNQSGFIVKSKQRRLLLLNDKVICVSVAPKQSHDFGATEKLSFKWMYPVADVEIVDNSTSATLSRILTAGLNRGGSLKSNSSSCNNDSPATILTNGADNLCNEMSTLMYDYEVISRIHDLVGSLKSNYSELNTNVTRNVLNTIQGSIQRKDEEMAWVDSCCLQLIAKNKSGKEETLTFQTENPSVKKEWITELRLAQLALDQNNSPAWEVPEHEQRPSTKMPLYVKAQPVYKSQHQSEVRCGCYYSVTNDNKVGTARRRHKHQNYLWVCTSNGTSSHIAVLSQHHQQAGNLRDVGSFDLVETQVTCMEHIKGLDNCKTKEEHSSLLGDLIWMGTDSRKILIYSATNPEQEEQLSTCSVSAMITRILYHFDSVFVALSNATMLIFRRAYDGVWLLKEPQVVQLSDGGLPVPSILPINMNIYASCGSRVYVLNALTGDIQKSFEAQHENTQQVNLMAHSGIGLWISLKNSSILCLYHTETFKHLQNINIAASVLRVKPSSKETINNSSIHVTALMAGHGLLWVGTNVGIAVTIPLPRLGGVPIISGGVNMSCHAHFGPITFLLPLLPKSYSNYKPVLPAAPVEQPSVIGDDLQLPAIDAEISKKDGLDDSTVILRKDLKDNDSTASSEQDSPRIKLDKQNSLDQSFSAKLKAQLANSPALRRKRFREMSDASRQSKTLPRGLGSASFFNNSIHSNTSTISHDHGNCDVYGLYGKLIFVKEDYDSEDGTQGMGMMDLMYEGLRRSDPDIASINGKVTTLDRRFRMKASRPRSLDLSNWSVDSKSSSLYTSSGSEESMGIRYFGGRSVSRNSSSASHKTSGNGSDLGNISENCTITVDVHHSTPKTEDKLTVSQVGNNLEITMGGSVNTNGVLSVATAATRTLPTQIKFQQPQQQHQHHQVQQPPTATTLKRKTKNNAKNNQNHDGPRSVITLMGGRGYWRHVWYNSNSPNLKPSTGGTMPRVTNSNDAHIVIWEKKL